MRNPNQFATWMFAGALIAACESKQAEKPSPPAAPAAASGAVAAPDAAKPEKKADARRSSEQCVGSLNAEPVATLKIAGREWERKGATLTEKTTDPDDTMVVGVIADLKEDTPENLANIDRFLSFFKQEKAELILVVGDTGETKAQIANNLKRVASSGLPVGIIIGNRECQDDFVAAVTEVSEKAQNVINLNAVRHIIADDAEFVTMPGYYNASFLHCTKGCQYYEEDVAALAPIVAAAKHPVTLVSHGPPRQSGSSALDWISEGTNEGDPVLAKFIVDQHIPFGVFANIHEAGGKATDAAGETQLKENTLVSSLYLNPGPGDSVRWMMNNGTESVGMAGLVTFKGKQASYKIFKVSSQTAKKK